MPPDPRTGGTLARAFRRYLNDPDLAPGSAASVLRGTFLATFAGQALVAALVAAVVALVAGRQSAPSDAVAIVAIAAATGQVLLGVAITAMGVRNLRAAAARQTRTQARQAALSQALLSAVLSSTPAWFAAFAWLTGQSPLVLATVVLVAAVGYAFGILQLGPLARSVTQARGAAEGETPPDEAASDESRPRADG